METCPLIKEAPLDPILILSSSRGGSSIFTELLRQHRGLVHLPGELNPLLHIAGLTFPHSGQDSDALSADDASRPEADFLDALIAAQMGGYGPTDTETLIDHCHRRLCLQWPALPLQRSEVADALHGLPVDDAEALTLQVIQRLQKRYPSMHPGFYDLDRQQSGVPPLPEQLIEEPPFILLSSWQHHQRGPLVIKTPSNAYRMAFFLRRWPNLRVLHLSRNPGAAINGLMDGWRYAGFHSHRIPLNVPGYSDSVPGGKEWWKFDLPPNWAPYQNAPLTDICAFQWASAHQHILEFLQAHPVDRLSIHFEDFLRDPHATIAKVCAWMGVAVDPQMNTILNRGLQPHMATQRPRQRRWFDRQAELEPLLNRPQIRDLAQALGYGHQDTWL